MQSGPDTPGSSSSFTARKAAASQLHFELPPRPLSTLDTKYPSFAPVNGTQSQQQQQQQQQPSGSVASVGNLLTPPNTLPGSGDGVSPVSPHGGAGGTSGTSSNAVYQSYNPSDYWQPNSQGPSSYGMQQSNSTQHWMPSRGVYSPSSLDGMVRTQGSVSHPQPEGHAGPSNDLYHLPPFPSSTSSTAPPVLPAVSTYFPTPTESSTMSSQSSAPHSASQASSINVSDGFYSRPTHSSSYFSPTQNSTPNSASYSYASTPSTIQTSPLSAGSQRTQMSPQSAFSDGSGFHRPSYSQSSNTYQRPPGQYPLPSMNGPIMSNMHSPNNNMALVGNLPSSMVPLTSGQAAHFQQMYGMTQPPSHSTPSGSNDRPFKCDQCMQSFNRNHDLKRHKRIHLAVKPFPCGHCDKSFSRKDALKRHILVKGCGKAQIPGRSSSSANTASEGPADGSYSSTKGNVSSHSDNYGQGDRHLPNPR
ncbi:MAG: hypothetical protein M1831_003411 [Alyxoria varia]|nr:MAG: hypothetical protein M1831_003411 [Alyxoria varia]